MSFDEGLDIYHGTDDAAKKEAIKRARRLNGYVVWSKSPGPANQDNGFGYWSYRDGMIRSWERQIWPKE